MDITRVEDTDKVALCSFGGCECWAVYEYRELGDRFVVCHRCYVAACQIREADRMWAYATSLKEKLHKIPLRPKVAPIPAERMDLPRHTPEPENPDIPNPVWDREESVNRLTDIVYSWYKGMPRPSLAQPYVKGFPLQPHDLLCIPICVAVCLAVEALVRCLF